MRNKRSATVPDSALSALQHGRVGQKQVDIAQHRSQIFIIRETIQTPPDQGTSLSGAEHNAALADDTFFEFGSFILRIISNNYWNTGGG